MPSWSKRSLIRWRISRATAHCSSGAVFSVTRTVIQFGVRSCTPHTDGSSMIRCLNSSSSHRSCATSSSTCWTRREVLVEGDRDVEHGARPVLALVADPQDLAVADVPDRALDVAEPGDPQADRLDGAAGLAEVDRVADAVLVLEDHEDAGQEVLDQALRAEAERDADDAGAGDAAGRRGSRARAIAVIPKIAKITIDAMLFSSEPIVSARCTRRPASTVRGCSALSARSRRRRSTGLGSPSAARRTSRSITPVQEPAERQREQDQDEDRQRLGDQPVGGLGEPLVPGGLVDPEAPLVAAGDRWELCPGDSWPRRYET